MPLPLSAKNLLASRFLWPALLGVLAWLTFRSRGLLESSDGDVGMGVLLVAWAVVCFMTVYKLVPGKKAPAVERPPTTFGSAQVAAMEDLQRLKQQKLLGDDEAGGLILGYGVPLEFRTEKDAAEAKQETVPLFYTGSRHLLTVAPTRGGKGVSAIIPNLLMYPGSAFVIDPKGENARITAARRGAGDAGRKIPGMGQKVYVVDRVA
jgi:type IV secretory pathway TraG/TraD family ATPase VirD4